MSNKTVTTRIDPTAAQEMCTSQLNQQSSQANGRTDALGGVINSQTTKIYVVTKHYGYEGHSAPIAAFDNIEHVKLFSAGFKASFDTGLRVYEHEMNTPNNDPKEVVL